MESFIHILIYLALLAYILLGTVVMVTWAWPEFLDHVAKFWRVLRCQERTQKSSSEGLQTPPKKCAC